MKALRFTILLFSYSLSFAQDQKVDESNVLQEADQLIRSYQFTKALVLLDQMEDSLSLDVLQRKGNCYLQMGNYNDAIKQYEALVESDSTNVNAIMALGQLYGRNKQIIESFLCYNKLIAMDSLNSYYYKQYGIVALQANAPAIAITNFFKAIQLNPGDMESYALVGDLLIEAGEYELAGSMLTTALQTNPSPQLNLLLARALLGEKKYEAVIKITRALMVKGDTLPAHARLMGISYFKLNKFEEAITWMSFLLNHGLKAEWISYYMGVSYQNLGKQDSAIIHLTHAIEEGISENLTYYYTQLASSYESIKDFKKAIKYYKAAYEKSRDDILLYHLGRNYDVYYKDKAQAIAYFKRYLESDDTIRLAREYSKSRLNELEFYR